MSQLNKSLFKNQLAASNPSIPENSTLQTDSNVEQAYSHSYLASDDISPLPYSLFFNDQFTVELSSDNDQLKLNTYRIPQTNKLSSPVTFIFHHGAGLSALSFGVVAKKLSQLSHGECSLIAYDARAHGQSSSTREDDLSLETLTPDLIRFITEGNVVDPASKLILAGHSLGGAVVVEAAHKMELDLRKRLLGVVVIDVVEGTAVDALPRMAAIIAKRPPSFRTPELAIEWALSNQTLTNTESARLSIPPQLKLNKDTGIYEWRTELLTSQQYWKGWFDGLSNKFLNCKTGKLLILAVTERLDKDLMIGQMQGKFQLHIASSEVGHNVHEDDPDQVAHWLKEFWSRNDSIVIPKRFNLQ